MDFPIRKALFQAYRIAAHLGLDDHTYTHLSARSSSGESFFIAKFGCLFQEITPEEFIEIGWDGEVIHAQDRTYNKTGYAIHAAIYEKRPDVHFIFHLHTPEIVAVSACEAGLLPISQWALHFYERMAYYEYNSLELDRSAASKLAESLGTFSSMLLRHHGSITCGATAQEAMFYTYHLQKACKTQCLALAMNQKLLSLEREVCLKSNRDLLGFEKNLGARDWQAWLRVLKID